MPDLTVLMTVYNGMPYLPEAIESVLNQTYADFKLLVVDDCSIDESRQVIRGYSDPRIRLLENEENLGQTRSLNRGLGMVDTELVARMDHDDISHPERLRKQVEFLVEHADIAVLGTCIRWIDAEGTVTGKKKLPEEDLVLRFFPVIQMPGGPWDSRLSTQRYMG